MNRALLTAVLTAGVMSVMPAHGIADLSKSAAPGGRVLLDAHNCYPYDGKWPDRIDRALSTGTPLAIEQDLFWYTDKSTGQSRSLVTHGEPITGSEPSMKDHFFEKIRPIVEKALQENRRDQWPLITLNLDLKSNEPAHHAAIWALLGEYEAWLTTAVKTANASELSPLDVKPVLVLTGSNDVQEQSFSTSQPVGSKLRLFGAFESKPPARLGQGREVVNRLVEVTPEEALPSKATNYRRWANFPWAVVEAGGQPKSGEWTSADKTRLKSLVDRAHEQNLWIRFYTLNGHPAPETATGTNDKGWFAGYNFGSEAAAQARWQAVIEAGVDFCATDQYEAFATVLHRKKS